ncbi:MAG: tyrosine-type recombinase/integrase [Planctomycetes bacterium]|nr:tyrosine-type recombinase/integrase [Planctomycetota bacterium]
MKKSVAFAAVVADYVQHLRERNLAPTTLDGQEYLAHRFLGYLEERGIADIRAVTRETLWEYATALIERPGSPRTKLQKLLLVRHLFRFLHRHGRILTDPAAILPALKVPVGLPRAVMTREEAELLLAQPDLRSPLGFRDRTMLETFYSTGIRSAELRALTIYDLDLGEGVLRINRGKGRKDRIVPLGKVAGKFLAEYVRRVRRWLARPNGETALFLTYGGTPVTAKLVNQAIGRYVKQSRIATRATTHTFRHTCATEMLRGGSSIRYVQELLGHADISTTQVYTRLLPLDLVQAHKKAHPRERQRKTDVPAPPAEEGTSFFHQTAKRSRKKRRQRRQREEPAGGTAAEV